MKYIFVRAILVTGISGVLLFSAGFWGKETFDSIHSTGLLVTGLIGTIAILLSLGYSLRKRYWKWGKISTWLRMHEVAAIAGTVVIMGHTGLRTHNITGWLDVALLLILCGSGVVGRYLYMELGKEVALRKRLQDSPPGLTQLQWWRRRFQIWRRLHIPLTHVFIILLLVHIVGTAFFGGW